MRCRDLLLLTSLLWASVVGSARASTVGYWRFEEGSGSIAADVSGNGNDAAILGAATFSDQVPLDHVPRTGDPNLGAISLGADSYLAIPATEVLNPTNQVTVEAWVRLDSPLNAAAPIVGRQYGGDHHNSFNLAIRGPSGGIFFEVTQPGGVIDAAAEIPGLLPLGEWHHLAGTYDGSAIQLFLDGELLQTTMFAGSIGYGVDRPLLIGADNEGVDVSPTYLFPGVIDEVRISNVALDPEEFLNGRLPGDANADGVVSGADYTIWADNFDNGVGPGGKSWQQGDWTGEGYVTGADYTIWADNYGRGLNESVPEPCAFVVALISLAVIVLLSQRIGRR